MKILWSVNGTYVEAPKNDFGALKLETDSLVAMCGGDEALAKQVVAATQAFRREAHSKVQAGRQV